jgi:hypothetical protein
MTEENDIRILLANLPPEVTEEDIGDALEQLGYDLSITVVREGSADRVSAVIRFEGMTRNTAETLAERINGMPWRDRILRAYVPLFLQ